ncbi:unnamed protein product [Ectocarpus sp. 6 AP-2014]
MGLVEKAVYRAVLRKARLFDKNIAAKALIQRHGIVRPPLTDSDAIGGDRRLYAAALEVVVGSHCHVRPERLSWSLQRLIRTIRMADQNNLEVVADRAAENEAKEAEGVPLEDRTVWEQDAMVAISLEIFFPGALKGVDGADKVGAGFAAIRELSSKWALAESLGLTEDLENNGQTSCVKRRRRKGKVAGPRNTTTKRALRVLRHQERRARAAGERNAQSTSPLSPARGFELDTRNSLARPGVVVEPTGTPAKGVYLISHPLSFLYAPEEMFHRSVVLLVDHSPLGSYGLVVNKDKGETLEEALCEDALPLASDALQQVLKNPVRVGGPVMSRLAWLHPHKEVGGVPLAEGAEKPVFFCGKMEKAAELLTKGTAKPADFSLVVGASAWDAGQLQGELNHGLWIMAKAPASFALAGGEDMWRDMLEAMGGPYAAMARVPHGRQWARAGVKISPSDWP